MTPNSMTIDEYINQNPITHEPPRVLLTENDIEVITSNRLFLKKPNDLTYTIKIPKLNPGWPYLIYHYKPYLTGLQLMTVPRGSGSVFFLEKHLPPLEHFTDPNKYNKG